jgi:hypothetical protein
MPISGKNAGKHHLAGESGLPHRLNMHHWTIAVPIPATAVRAVL